MSNNNERVIRLSYDVISPFSYLAYAVLKRYRTIWKFRLELNPALIAGLMIAAKNTSARSVLKKEIKLQEEFPLMAKFFGVKAKIPQKFPFRTLPVMRFLKVIKNRDPDQLENITDKFFKEIFENEIKEENLHLIFDTITPEPYSRETVEEYLRISVTDEIKEAVKNDTIELADQGAFGFPWIDVTDFDGRHLTIFGSDRFEFLANWLGEEWKGPNPQKSKL